MVGSALNFALEVPRLDGLLGGGLKLSIPIPGRVFVGIIIGEPFEAARL